MMCLCEMGLGIYMHRELFEETRIEYCPLMVPLKVGKEVARKEKNENFAPIARKQDQDLWIYRIYGLSQYIVPHLLNYTIS